MQKLTRIKDIHPFPILLRLMLMGFTYFVAQPVYRPLVLLVGIIVLVIPQLRQKTARNNLLTEILSRQEVERKRIAKDLHDEIGQNLTALILNLQDLKNFNLEDAVFSQRIDWLTELTANALEEMERLVSNLRPGLLEELGLVAALRWYINTYVEPTGIKVAWTVEGFQERLPENMETSLYRILQEAITNVLRHAHASSIGVLIKQTRGKITLEVEDDGQGFEAKPSNYGWGLKGLKERIDNLRGELHVVSRAGKGTSVRIVIPVKEEGVGRIE
ncbi:MAG: sensor histidine kinase [Bacillota bacterium]